MLDLAILDSKIDPSMVTQVLDDVVACGAQGDGSVTGFEQSYRSIATKTGVSLADGSDPEKAFSATHSGRVLGISYDLENWRWWLADDKLVPLLHMMRKVSVSNEVSNSFMMSLMGKINHYQFLVPGGQWQRGFLLPLQDSSLPPIYMWSVSDLAKEQAAWWLLHMRVAAKASSIKDLRPMERMKIKMIFTDAAGGAEGKYKNGIGGFSPPHSWFYMPWPERIRCDIPTSLGIRFARKLSALEGFAALVGLASMPDVSRNSEVRLLCDNSGFVYSYEAKHSKCPYVYTIAKAINDVSVGLACNVKVVKTLRYTNTLVHICVHLYTQVHICVNLYTQVHFCTLLYKIDIMFDVPIVALSTQVFLRGRDSSGRPQQGGVEGRVALHAGEEHRPSQNPHGPPQVDQ